MLYVSSKTRDELIDALTNAIDFGIRKGHIATYDQFQKIIQVVLCDNEAKTYEYDHLIEILKG